MPRPLSDQSVVVVGASSGIGRAAALSFGRAGAAVTAAARSAEDLDTLVTEIQAGGGRALAVPTDVSDPDAVQALADRAEQQYGRIDTWVNAAAVSVWGRFDDITPAEYARVMEVNFLGQVHGTLAAVPALRRAGGGVLMGISSVEGVRAVPLHAPYTASKWALRGFYDCVRMELQGEAVPIAVTTILPASIDTPFFEHARSKLEGGAMPKPPPPVYSADTVAKAILRAAVRPAREVPVGGAAVGFFLGQRLNPALTDAILSLPRLQKKALASDHPDDPRDNLDAPMTGTGRTSGAHPGRVLQSSAFTTALGSLPRPGELVGRALARARR